MKILGNFYIVGLLLFAISAFATFSYSPGPQAQRVESRDRIPDIDEAHVYFYFRQTQWADSRGRGGKGPYRFEFHVSGDEGHHLRILPEELSIRVQDGTTTTCDLSEINWEFQSTGQPRGDWATGSRRSEAEVMIEYNRPELIDIPTDPEREITLVFRGTLVTVSGQQEFDLQVPLVSYWSWN